MEKSALVSNMIKILRFDKAVFLIGSKVHKQAAARLQLLHKSLPHGNHVPVVTDTCGSLLL
jgi:hypothetical protein